MKFFIYDQANESVRLNEESILLTKEFEILITPLRNKSTSDKTGVKKIRAFKEFKYIYLYFDWGSPYFQYAEQDRHREAFLDSGLTKAEFEDVNFKNACNKYDELQNSSRIGKLLKASYNSIDKITHYLDTMDLNERDPVSGKPIFKTKDVIAEIASSSKLIDAVKTLELAFKKETETESSLRGDKEPGMFDR